MKATSYLPAICAVLRGESPRLINTEIDAHANRFLSEAREHGVSPLLDARFHASNWAGVVSNGVVHECHSDALEQVVRDLATGVETSRVIQAFTRSGIKLLLMKGTALAYSHYPSPALRMRADCDVLVQADAVGIAVDVLNELGYQRIRGPAGEFVGYQIEFRRDTEIGISFFLDLHWRISNSQSFAWLYSFEELASTATLVPALGNDALRLRDAHALHVALLHRAGNNKSVGAAYGDRLVWLYDVHLLVEAMSASERELFQGLVNSKRTTAIAIDGLSRAHFAFGSARVEELVNSLRLSDSATSGEVFLRAGRFRLELLELFAIPTNWVRLRYVMRRAIPCASYMRERYPTLTQQPIFVLHLRRWFERVGLRHSYALGIM